MVQRVSGLTAVLCLAAAAVACGPAAAESLKMKADLKGTNEVPPTASPGTGSVDVTYDTASRLLSWTGAYSGLTGTATAAHFHGPAETGKNAPVMIPSPSATPLKGSATLTEAQAADLTSGKLYFNVHTQQNPGGEIRGQVTN